MQCNVRGFVHCLFTVFVLIEEISVACQHNKSDIPSSTRGAGGWEARGTMAPPNFVDIEKRTEVEIEMNNLLVVPPPTQLFALSTASVYPCLASFMIHCLHCET